MSTEPIKNNLADEAIKVLEQIAYDSPFNPFKVMRNGDHEIRHSNTLAWLFDSKENHELGDKFAVCFFSEIFKDVDWNNKFNGEITIETEVASNSNYFDTYKEENENKYKENEKREDEKFGKEKGKKKKADDESKPEKEKSDNNKKIDIFIKGKDFTITIENKYGSGEHDWQCQRYRFDRDKNYSKYTNYYIFLDIEEPDDWRIGKNSENENLRYAGYKLITYDDVRKILKDLTNGKKETDSIKFIKQYIEILDETYGEYNEKIVKIMNDSFSLAQSIFELDSSVDGMTPRLLEAQRVFKNYIKKIQKENEKLIKDELTHLVKGEVLKVNPSFINYHAGSAAVSNPYGYELNLDNYKNKDNDYTTYLREIDYVAKYGRIRIAFYYGLSSYKRSENMCEYARNRQNFKTELNILKSKNWQVKIIAEIRNSSRASKIKVLEKEITTDQFSTILDNNYWGDDYVKKTIKDIKENDILDKSGEVREDNPLLNMLEKIYGKKSEDYDDVVKKIKDYFDRIRNNHKKNIDDLTEKIKKYDSNKKNKKDLDKLKSTLKREETKLENGNFICFNWQIELVRYIESELIITEDDRKSLKPELGKLFYEKTREGLNLFGLGDRFVETVFNKPENCE